MFKLYRLLLCSVLVLNASVSVRADWVPPSDRIVVMLSVDGLAAFYFDDPKADMPTIRQLAREGARSTMMQVSTPTVTWPNHITLVTGVNPAKHGVIANNCFDRVSGQPVTFIGDPVFDKDQAIRVPTLYDLAKAKGLKTAAVRWPGTRNARALDWIIPAMKIVNATTNYCTAALLDECEAAGIHVRAGYEQGKIDDDMSTQIFNLVLAKHHPNFALLHVGYVDYAQHQKGPRTPEAYAAVKAADGQVNAVWEELRKDYPGKATLLVVSDHGFSPIFHSVLPNVVLRQAGLLTQGEKEKDRPIRIVIDGGSAFIYILDDARRAELASKITKAFSAAQGVSKIIGPEQFKAYGVGDPAKDPRVPDLILFAEEGCAFAGTANGEQPFKDKLELTGTHGHDSTLPHLHATFVAWGYGIKPGTTLGEISSTSVAPTIAELLQMRLPDQDGPTLNSILLTPQ